MEDFDVPTEDSSGESSTFLMDQLKSMMAKRSSALEQIKEIYANDPAAKRSPFDAGMRQLISDPAMGGTHTFSWGPSMQAMEKQEQYRKQNALAPHLIELNNLDVDPFTKLYNKVKSSTGSSVPFEIKVAAPGVVLVHNRATGAVTTMGVDDVGKFNSMYQMHYKTLIEGGETDIKKAQANAWELAQADVGKAKGFRNMPGLAGESPSNGSVRVPAISTDGTVLSPGNVPAQARPDDPELDAAKAALAGGQMSKLEFDRFIRTRPVPDKPGPNVFGAPVGSVPPKLAAAVGGAPAGSQPITIKSEQQKATESQLGKLHADENTADREALSAMQELERNRAVMSDIINSGKHTSSPMHELLSTAGGFMSLIDPNGSLAKAAGNDQMYYSSLMNLVRDKIKALGSGTAVSNLDLIVTQKSVGDLRNTAEGNKKLLAVMELQNATMMAKMGGKLNYFDQAKTYDKYRGDSSATHILRRSPKTGDYWVQSREDWINEQVKAGTVRNPEEAGKFFEQEARSATKRMIRGTSLDPDYYKK